MTRRKQSHRVILSSWHLVAKVGALYTAFMRWAFARFYREFAWTYDTVAALVSGGHWRDWALVALPYARGQVLELGCGTGNLQCALARDVPAHVCVGLDLSPQMLRHTQRKAARAGVAVQLARGDARSLPFADASFDTLLATFPSEYIVAEMTLAEARRVLRPGGWLVILLGAQLSGSGLYERLVDLAYRLTLQSTPRATRASDALPDVLAPFDTKLRHALAQAGFDVHGEWIAAPGGFVYIVLGELDTCQVSPKS